MHHPIKGRTFRGLSPPSTLSTAARDRRSSSVVGIRGCSVFAGNLPSMHISAASHKNRKQRSNPYFPAAHPTGFRATTMPMPESASSELMTLAGSAGFDARKMPAVAL